MMNDTTKTIKHYIMEEFLPDENPDELTEQTQLFTSGLLDSIASLNLVGFLEREFGITVEAHEVVAENLDTLVSLTQFVASKRS